MCLTCSTITCTPLVGDLPATTPPEAAPSFYKSLIFYSCLYFWNLKTGSKDVLKSPSAESTLKPPSKESSAPSFGEAKLPFAGVSIYRFESLSCPAITEKITFQCLHLCSSAWNIDFSFN